MQFCYQNGHSNKVRRLTITAQPSRTTLMHGALVCLNLYGYCLLVLKKVTLELKMHFWVTFSWTAWYDSHLGSDQSIILQYANTELQTRVSKGPDVPLYLCPRTKNNSCPGVPLSRDKEGTSVPLSRKVALSRPVGNASMYLFMFKLVQGCC